MVEIVRFKTFKIRYYGGAYVGTFLDKQHARSWAEKNGWIIDYIKEI